MSIATSAPGEWLSVCAELIDWSQRARLTGDYVRLWRKHEAIFQRIDASVSRPGAGPTYQLRYLELEIWVDTLHRSLRPDILARVATTFASGGGSTLWDGLEPGRRRRVAHARKAHACSAEASFTSALLRFQGSPACGYLAEAMRALADLVETRSPRTQGFSAEQLSQGLERLAHAIVEEIPPVAREVLASEVEERFAGLVDRSWLDDVSMTRSSFGPDQLWAPTWAEFRSPHSQVEPTGRWFVPEMQARYEQRRLAREVEQAHAEAQSDERRRSNEIAQERRKLDDECGAVEEQEQRELAVRKSKEDRDRFMGGVHEEARKIVRDQMEGQGLTLKHIPEPERSARIREVADQLLRRYEGKKRTRWDAK